MNEHIEELIIAYLHKGTTPEQEQELFNACRDNPETAQYLREHLILSLKLKQLRNSVEVPLDARNAVITAINELKIESTASKPSTAAVETPRFGWRHLFGTGLAAAALSAAVFFMVNSGPPSQPGIASSSSIHDTLRLVQTDTVTQIREIQKPVFIARNVPAPATTRPDELPSNPVASTSARSIEPSTPASVAPTPVDRVTIETGQLAMQDDATSYLEYYKTMLSTLKIVHITPSDRIRN
jgi:hypothetical protein